MRSTKNDAHRPVLWEGADDVKALMTGTLVAAAVAIAGGCVTVKTPQAANRPATSDALLQLARDKWKSADVVKATSNPQCQTGTPESADGVVAGDFNGDGTPDLAAQVSTPDGVHLVAAIVRTDQDQLVDIAKVPESGTQLAVSSKGARYFKPQSQFDFYYGTDTITLADCSQVRTAYVWNGTGFQSMPVAAQTDAQPPKSEGTSSALR
jgi:hypothetical protein